MNQLQQKLTLDQVLVRYVTRLKQTLCHVIIRRSLLERNTVTLDAKRQVPPRSCMVVEKIYKGRVTAAIILSGE
jgi:hypothetical protein